MTIGIPIVKPSDRIRPNLAPSGMNRFLLHLSFFSALSFCQPLDAVTIWPLGDSLTSGFTRPGAYRPQLHADLAAAGIPVDFVGSATNDSTPYLSSNGETHHDGHSGWFISDSASSVDDGKGIFDAVPGWHSGITQPDVILLLIGTNDLNQGNLVASAPLRFEALLSRLEGLAPEARIIVGSIPMASETNTYKAPTVSNLNDSIDGFNSSIRGIAEDHADNGARIEFLDVNAAMGLSDLGSDGLHFSQAGYDKLGSLWAEAVQVPEPGSSVLLVLGSIGILGWLRRR